MLALVLSTSGSLLPGSQQVVCCSCRMDPVKQQLDQLNMEVAAVIAKVEAAQAAWLSSEDPQQKADLKEVYEDLKEEKKRLQEGRRALEAKLSGPGE